MNVRFLENAAKDRQIEDVTDLCSLRFLSNMKIVSHAFKRFFRCSGRASISRPCNLETSFTSF